jgi:hypothetical protein
MAEPQSQKPEEPSPAATDSPPPTLEPEELAAHLEATIATLPTELLCRLARLLEHEVQDRALQRDALAPAYYRSLARDNAANRTDPDYPFK